jgi:RNA polymerase sigma-70 factor (ECF subfamily)
LRIRETFEGEALPHLEALLRSAVRLSGNRDRAEDVVQETYLRAWRSFQTYRPDTNCRAWLFKILLNVLRKEAGRKRRDPLEGAEEAEGSGKVVPLFPGLEAGKRRDILDAFAHLGPEFRQVLWLVVVENFTYREVAELLGIPIGTVMSRLHRARRDIRRLCTWGEERDKGRRSGHGV